MPALAALPPGMPSKECWFYEKCWLYFRYVRGNKSMRQETHVLRVGHHLGGTCITKQDFINKVFDAIKKKHFYTCSDLSSPCLGCAHHLGRRKLLNIKGNSYYEQQLLSEPIARVTVTTTGSTSSVSLLILNCPTNVKAIADHEELEAQCFNPEICILACRAQRCHQATHGTQSSQARSPKPDLPLDTVI